ncbi:hypothetical protein H072_3445 [Dactylellina haptotyla CBS 200.50]|uniref:LysM domain-containing protein n=1 Tax=Dactylellina haptotyla (strain CBS 200.50) TaxID=1284197 RepID=S8AIB3_DACHA|nr:hypothetical protein H072_3445 [Dactylellina haptotyla CBS 200.50]
MWFKTANSHTILLPIFTIIVSILSLAAAQDATTTSSAVNPATTTPSPLLEPIPTNCVGWRYIATYDTCPRIITRFQNISLTYPQLTEYNPSLDCTALIPRFYICVRVDGPVALFASTTGTVSSSTSPPTSGPTSDATSSTIGAGTGTPSNPINAQETQPASGPNTGVIVGAVLGGLALLAFVIVSAIWLVTRERRKREALRSEKDTLSDTGCQYPSELGGRELARDPNTPYHGHEQFHSELGEPPSTAEGVQMAKHVTVPEAMRNVFTLNTFVELPTERYDRGPEP